MVATIGAVATLLTAILAFSIKLIIDAKNKKAQSKSDEAALLDALIKNATTNEERAKLAKERQELLSKP